LSMNMLRPGVHINAIGGDCPGKTELHPDILNNASVFVEYEPQTRIEGEIQQMPADFPVTELWKVLTGVAAGRITSDQITVFDSVGFALEDFSAMRYIKRLALANGGLESLGLIPDLTDPKNLYGLLVPTEVA
jgi:ornithine cyclodeaminase